MGPQSPLTWTRRRLKRIKESFDQCIWGIPSIQQSLWRSCRDGKTEKALESLRNGAQMDLQSSNGVTALMCSILNGRKECALMLIENGASVNIQDGTGATALHFTCRKAYLPLAIKLIKAGADATICNYQGVTAFEVYGRSRSLPPASNALAIQDMTLAVNEYLDEQRAQQIWNRRWPFLCVLIGCRLRPIAPRNLYTFLAHSEVPAGPDTALGILTCEKKHARLLFQVFCNHGIVDIIFLYL